MTALVAPACPDTGPPSRRPRSARRTSSIDTTWPGGYGKPMTMAARARDIVTATSPRDFSLRADDGFRLLALPDRTIVEISGSRSDEALQQLIGVRAGSGYRRRIKELFPEEIARATPLNLLLDDFGGASLVAPWAWSRWSPDWMKLVSGAAGEDGAAGPAQQRPARPSMAGTCVGYRPDSWALRKLEAGLVAEQNSAFVEPLADADDPEGWHALKHAQPVAHMRRARRLDVWIDDGIAHIDAHFQDSASEPGSQHRRSVHEYRIAATADLETAELLSLAADPRILPYGECPAAAPNATMLVGMRLADLRDAVPRTLMGTLGCTHLNDTLRSLSDAPALLEYLVSDR